MEKKVIDIAGGFYHTIVLVKNKKVKEISLISTDMKKIVNEPQRADVTFIVEGKPVHGHRCIFFARCKALEEKVKQFGKKSDEREKAKYGITHKNHVMFEFAKIKYKAFAAFIEYLYTDRIK